MKKVKIENKLKSYAAVAASTLVAGVANGQVVYTDVNPDQTFTLGGGYVLDVDNNTVTDFTFQVGTSYVTSGTINVNVKAGMINGPASNEVIGQTQNVGGQTLFLADTLLTGDNISTAANWLSVGATAGWPVLLGGQMKIGVFPEGGAGNFLDVTDKYVGLKFQIGADVHYGWARFDVSADGLTYTIKDYAYESLKETPIEAGKTTSGYTDVDEKDELNVNVFQYGESLFIDTKNEDISDGQLTVVDLSGKIVLTTSVSETREVINISALANGTYVVSLQLKSGVATKKISVQR